MKLRIRGNSLRLRLLQREVSQLRETGVVSETIQFGLSPTERLVYSVEICCETPEISAHFVRNQIAVMLPQSLAHNWIESGQISLNGEQTISNTTSLRILIEKDFVCLDRANDPDNADAFPHPTMRCC